MSRRTAAFNGDWPITPRQRSSQGNGRGVGLGGCRTPAGCISTPSSCSFHPIGGLQGRLDEYASEPDLEGLGNSAEDWLQNGGQPPDALLATGELLEAELMGVLMGGARSQTPPSRSSRGGGGRQRNVVDVRLGQLPGLTPSAGSSARPGGSKDGCSTADTLPLTHHRFPISPRGQASPGAFASPRFPQLQHFGSRFGTPHSVPSAATPGIHELEIALLEFSRQRHKVDQNATREVLFGEVRTPRCGQAKEAAAAVRIQAVERGRREREQTLRLAAQEVLSLRQRVAGFEDGAGRRRRVAQDAEVLPKVIARGLVDKARLRCELREVCAERDVLRERLQGCTCEPRGDNGGIDLCTPKAGAAVARRRLLGIATPCRARTPGIGQTPGPPRSCQPSPLGLGTPCR